jgi:hypothetical protein
MDQYELLYTEMDKSEINKVCLTTYPFEAFNTTVLLEFIEDSKYFCALTS